VLASPAEQAQMRPLLEALGSRALLPRTTVGQMMAIVSRANLVVSNDSAALHMAVGFDRAIVAVFGPTEPGLVGPYRRLDTVVRPAGLGTLDGRVYRQHRNDQSLIERVTVNQVWEKIQEQLTRSKERQSSAAT